MPICCQSASRTRHTTMRDDEPPLPPPSPPPTITRHPSRLRRTLHSLRSSFRSTSPFHISSIKRANSTKSSASDSEISRNDNTMRKKNKKQRASTASDTSGTSNSTNGSPIVNVKRTGSLIRRIGSNSAKQDDNTVNPLEGASSTQELPTTSKHYTPNINIDESSVKYEVKSDSIDLSSTEPKENKRAPLVSPEPTSPEPTVSPIATTHKIAIKAFTKDAWKRKVKTEIPKPVEERGPESALRRRIAFVTQASMYLSEDAAEDDDDEEGGGHEVGTLEEAVKLARLQRRLETSSASAQTTPLNRSRDNLSTEEEGFTEAMPPYGDLIEPEQEKQEEAAPSHASPNAERREHLYKILVIGELGTGKTSIIKRYVHQFFSQHYRATIGVDFALKVINWDANTIIRLQLWDIAGQERFGNMTRVYYKEAVGAFIVFDVSRVATFEAVVKWKSDLDTKVQLPDGSSIPCILLANKCDQQKEGVVNTPAKMDEYCKEKGFAGWFETSAKENINIEEAARALVNKILLNDKILRSNDSRDSEKFALEHKIANGENNRVGRHKSCSC